MSMVDLCVSRQVKGQLGKKGDVGGVWSILRVKGNNRRRWRPKKSSRREVKKEVLHPRLSQPCGVGSPQRAED